MDIKIPKGEVAWLRYYNKEGKCMFLMTSKPLRDYYYLYEVQSGGSVKKLGRSRNPAELEEQFDVDKRIGVAR